MSSWWEWHGGEDYSVGIEEEVMVLDPGAGWSLAARVAEVQEGAGEELEERLDDETQDAVLELATDPHPGPRRAGEQVRESRARLGERLRSLGLRAGSAGTHPTHLWSDTRIAEGERHREVYRSMRELARREPTFGLHVHVGVADPERAIRLHNRLRGHLPLLLALSANSPFWQGRDTGMASARTPIFQAFPRVGMPQAFASYERWRTVVDRLLGCGAFPEPTYLWWDVRPQPRFGTVEIRIMDAQSDPGQTRALAALVQSLARYELEEAPEPDGDAVGIEILTENRFIAARDGMGGRFVDPANGTCTDARHILEDLLTAVEPHAEDLGCAAELAGVGDLAQENGAARQRRVHERRGSLADVVEDLAERF